ncbi:MAG TPA: VOC family protein [Acidobacteriaceae bacterium]
MKLNTYLNFGGNCEEALRFYEQHLGGKITSMMKWSQMPDAEKHTPPGYADAILHARLELGDTVVMASDVPKDRFQPMRSVYLSLSVGSSEEAERIYKLLTDGGEVYMAMGETFFAHRFGQFRDKFGTSWMVIHERQMPQSATTKAA